MNRAFFRIMYKHQRNKLLKISTGIVLYEGLLAWVYPLISDNKSVSDIVGSIPSTVKTVFGVSPEARTDTFEAFISAQFFSRIWSVLLAIYGINTANSLLSKLIDDGSLVFPLTTPVPRSEIITTQNTVLLAANSTIIGATIGGLLVWCSRFGIPIKQLRCLYLGTLALTFFTFISSYSFLLAAWIDGEERASAYAYALTFVFYAFDVIGGLSKRSAWVGSLSIFKIFKPQEILEGSANPFPAIAGLTAGSALLTFVTMKVFEGRDLPL